ncbi:MAG: class I SAM-dependent methyltransferase [Pirellulaceae bacterium]|nr:class I SAM-dependent methyltransferase [Pirellulaceae bacterium]
MVNWSQSRELFHGRLVAKYNESEAKSYDAFVGTLTKEDEEAYLADIQEVSPLLKGHSILDVGAGSGALTKILSRVDGLVLTAMEPSPDMRELLRSKPELAKVPVVEGGCDSLDDRQIFPESNFDSILSRQVVNSLFDPLVAFQNWLYWLKPGGSVVVIDGIYGRDGWTGVWEEEVDVTPLAACQSLATIPYLLEFIGFRVEMVNWMTRTNRLPATRTKRYLVVAKKPK